MSLIIDTLVRNSITQGTIVYMYICRIQALHWAAKHVHQHVMLAAHVWAISFCNHWCKDECCSVQYHALTVKLLYISTENQNRYDLMGMWLGLGRRAGLVAAQLASPKWPVETGLFWVGSMCEPFLCCIFGWQFADTTTKMINRFWVFILKDV